MFGIPNIQFSRHLVSAWQEYNYTYFSAQTNYQKTIPDAYICTNYYAQINYKCPRYNWHHFFLFFERITFIFTHRYINKWIHVSCAHQIRITEEFFSHTKI